MNRSSLLFVYLALLLSISPCLAADNNSKAAEPKEHGLPLLVSDEPNTLGVAEDGYEGVPYMDFNVSIRHPLRYVSRMEGRSNTTGLVMPYLSFSGRMSQYFNRRSAPVVTKRFNPKLMIRTYGSEPREGKRIWIDDNDFDYHDVGYAHESNGQYVDSVAAFDAVATNFGSADIAQDYVHRGWDYLDYKRHLHFDKDRIGVLDFELKYFLNHGLGQKNIVELYPWETPGSVTHISQVDGIRLKAGIESNERWFKNAHISWITGYRDIAKFNTVRIESAFTPLSSYLGVPVLFWWQTGYDNSVARFYLHAWSAGMTLSFETME